MDWNENRTPYDILGVAADATDEQIRKAFKTLALKKHPDKNKNNPAAAAEFQELETAYRALTDGSVKEALDSFLRAKLEREARYSRQDEKRRKMREDLARKEKEVVGGRREEDTARSRLQAELARLRRKMEEEQLATAVKAREATEAVAAASKGQPASSAQPDEATQSQLERTLKAVWDANIRDYRPEELRQIFAVHGTVEDVVIRSSKKKRQVSALVVMATKDAADAAIGSVNGDADAPLLVMPLLKVPPPESASTGTEPRTSPTPPPPHTSTSSSHAPSTTTGARSFPIPTSQAASTSGQQPAPSFPIPGAASSNGTAGVASTGAGPGPSARAAPAPPGGNSAASIFGSFPGVGGAASQPGGAGRGVGGSGLEATILEKMKRAAERDRMLREAKEQEEGKAGGS